MATWHFQDMGSWVLYSQADTNALENAYTSGRTTLTLGPSRQYSIDITNLTQKNIHTGYTRPIRRTAPTSGSALSGTTSASQHHPSTYPPLSSSPTWSFEERSSWIVCSRAGQDSATYESMYQRCVQTKQPIASLTSGGFTYTLDFAAMTQTNEDYGTTRNLQRNPPLINCPLQSLTSTPDQEPLDEYLHYLSQRQSDGRSVTIPQRTIVSKIENIVKKDTDKLRSHIKASNFGSLSFTTPDMSVYPSAADYVNKATGPFMTYTHYMAWKEALENGTQASFPYSEYIVPTMASSPSQKDKKDKKNKRDQKKDKKDKKEKKELASDSLLAAVSNPFSFPSLVANYFEGWQAVDDSSGLTGVDDEAVEMEDEPTPTHTPLSHQSLTCPICLCALWDIDTDDGDDDQDEDLFPVDTILHLPCSHTAHSFCLSQHFSNGGSHSGSCPICKHVLLSRPGPMPNANLTITFTRSKCSGYSRSPGSVHLDIDIKAGVQDSRHPNPGVAFSGDSRNHIMPQTPFVMKILLPLFLKAFLYRHLLTVGHSFTRSQDDVVIYTSIHFKTSPNGGAASHGYPDPGCEQNSVNELSDCGIKLYEDELS